MSRDIKIVLAGHIDHGKSTLIGRLLYETGSLSDELTAALARIADAGDEDRTFAYVLDHLSEERHSNITIDTAQVFLRYEDRHYVLIDAPGHKEFVRNMITGASQADAAILIVSASDGVCEQTRRHCNLLAMLGVRHILIVVNKMDNVLYSRRIFEHIRQDLADHMARLGLTARLVLPMSAQRGENLIRRSDQMPWYGGPTLMQELASLDVRQDDADLLAVPVQDVYQCDGDQAWRVGGRIESGSLTTGQAVWLYPDGGQATVAGIQTFNGDVAGAKQDWCVLLRLEAQQSPRRGQIIAGPGSALKAGRQARARIFWMSQQPLAEGASFEFACATQAATCTVERIVRVIDSATLEPVTPPRAEARFTEIVEADISFDAPMIHLPFAQLPELGRFTLSVDKEVCAGGIFDIPATTGS